MLETHDDVFHGFSQGNADVDCHDADFAVFNGIVCFIAGDEEGVVLDFSGEISRGPEFTEEIGEHAFDAVAQLFSIDFEDDPLGIFIDGASNGVEDPSRHEVAPFWCVGEGACAPRSDASLGGVADAVNALIVELGVLSFVHGCMYSAKSFDCDVCRGTENAVIAVAASVDACHEARGWYGDGIAVVVEHVEPRVIERGERSLEFASIIVNLIWVEVARRIEEGEAIAHFFAVRDHGSLYTDHVARAVESFAVIKEELEVGNGDEINFVV